MSHTGTWEYLEVHGSEVDEKRLNQLGAERWELIVAIPGGAWVFKRPGPDFRTRVTLSQRDHVFANLDDKGDNHA